MTASSGGARAGIGLPESGVKCLALPSRSDRRPSCAADKEMSPIPTGEVYFPASGNRVPGFDAKLRMCKMHYA